jgi:hypothetical protein
MFGNTSLGLRRTGPPHGGNWRRRLSKASVSLAIGAGAMASVHADPSVVLSSGLPVQVKPTFLEPGLPAFSFPVGGSSSVGGSTSTVNGVEGGSGSGGNSSTGGEDAHNTMMGQDWGAQAEAAASAMGVSAAALAATCLMESNCQNVGSSGGSSATGAKWPSARRVGGSRQNMIASPRMPAAKT